MDFLYDVFPVILFVLATILLIVLIILGIRLITTLKKVNEVVDNVNSKVGKLDTAFMAVDALTDTLSKVNDKIVSFVADGIRNIFKKRKRKRKADELNEEE